MPEKQKLSEKRRAHLQLQKGLPRPPKPKRNRKRKLTALRRELSRRSSQRSIDAHLAVTQPDPASTHEHPNPLTFDSFDPSDNPNPPDNLAYTYVNIENTPPPILEVDMDAIWDCIRRARPYALVELPEETVLQTRTHVTTEDSESTGDPPTVLSTDSEREVEYNPATYGLTPGAFVREHLLVKAAKQAPNMLAPDSWETIMDFNFFVQQKTSVRSHKAMQKAYCRRTTHTNIPSLKEIRRQMLALSALKPVDYHCCRNSCVCFTGYLSNISECPYCRSPRLNPAGAPYAVFSHIPLTPQLLAMFRNPSTYEKMLYRSRHLKDGEIIKDVFDGLLYEYLRQTSVSVDGEKFPFKHFEDFRELALMIMLDGMAPFKKRKHSCWPIIIINFNLAPDICMHQDNIICVGAIPGPHSPKDINSFLQPLIDELSELAKGVEAVDVVREEVFSLRAHVIAAGGDLPAISKLMEFIGHNEAPHDTSRANRATECGIKGVTLLARLSSIRIPDSFPVEVMHMIWINLVPQLMDLWQEKFSGLDSGMEDYGIDPLLVNSLGTICTNSGALFPVSFGCRVPHFKNRSHFTAESWSIWALYYAPHLLRGRFRKPEYYTHFVRLISILKEVMDYEIACSELPRIRKEIADWVEDFEIIYYQYDEERLRHMGPVCVYWSYPMERYCSFVGAAVKSRRFPYANIARRLLDVAQLRTAREIYNLHESISFGQTRASTEGDKAIELAEADRIMSREYEHILLLTPRSEPLIITPLLRNKINKYLATAFGVTISKKVSNEIIPGQLKQWGRIRIMGGDLIHARGYHKLRPDGRDASFIRYEQLVDTLAHRRKEAEDLEQTSCYGQVQHVFRLDLPPKTIINKAEDPKVLLLALVCEAPVKRDYSFEYSVISYSGELSSGEVIDASTIACAVGRVKDKKHWWIIDRSSGLGDIEFVD
ncbi:Transposase family tnp2 [Rhizoctonia solani]|uniref:Transposase family tnp2 n=1 Tax=Rhizoctonia solani TaxID=456999 RepID=A0A8H7H7G4_9AGAM|nr:Transposase family tnp2 [Rhizoctonia solani]